MKLVSSQSPVDQSSAWMINRGWTPQKFQLEAWNAWYNGLPGLVNAPTGSGKTYSLLLPQLFSINQNPVGLQLIWITPIRALAKEIFISAMRVIEECGLAVTVGIRTGDTSEADKASQYKLLPNVLITTPESLHLLIARKGCTKLLAPVQMLVADEWHELLGTKRGVMLELAVAHIKSINPNTRVWGISATIGNIKQAMEVLLGDASNKGLLIKADLKKNIEVISILPEKVEELPWAGHLGIKMASRIIPVIKESGSSIIFTNTRAQCEIWYKTILEEDIALAGSIAMHHGSISRELRHWVEDALSEGKLSAVVSTSSLDLGVDFAPVDTIIQIGGPKGVARFVQRAGRSGHRPDAASKIFFLPTHSLELIEAAALRSAIEADFLESREPMLRCFDVLIQFMVTLSLGDGLDPGEAFTAVASTFAFQDISPEEWNWLLAFCSTGGSSLGAYPEHHKMVWRDDRFFVANQRIARRHRLSIGAIVSDTMMAVKFKRGGTIGHIEEAFIASLKEGEHFWFAGQALELVQVKELTAFVKKTTKTNGKIPSWQGGKLPLSSRMSEMLRQKVHEAAVGQFDSVELRWIKPLLDIQQRRSHLPKADELLIECFESEDGFHTVFYPFEGRFVHEGLAALVAYRIGEQMPISFSLAYNDYAFELLSDTPFELNESLVKELFSKESFEQDVIRGVNSSELANRRFREIAAIGGLVFKGFPGAPIRDRHLQSSSQLFFKVFEEYDPQNLLFRQAFDEVINFQLEMPRMRLSVARIETQKILIRKTEKPTPFAFPVMVDRLREKMSSEDLSQRIAKMVIWASN